MCNSLRAVRIMSEQMITTRDVGIFPRFDCLRNSKDIQSSWNEDDLLGGGLDSGATCSSRHI